MSMEGHCPEIMQTGADRAAPPQLEDEGAASSSEAQACGGLSPGKGLPTLLNRTQPQGRDLKAAARAVGPVEPGTERDLEAATKPKLQQAAPRLVALDAPRWIASVLIVLEHFYSGPGEDRSLDIWHTDLGTFSQWGTTWSQFFFILSGFVLSYAEMVRPTNSAKGQLSTWEYVKKRLISVYPTYALTIMITFFQRKQTAGALITLPLNVLMLQAWLPVCYPAEDGTWLGNPGNECTYEQWTKTGWFMSVLFFYWLLVRPMARRMRRASLRGTLAVLAACWIWSFILGISMGGLKDAIFELESKLPYRYPVLFSVVQFGPAGYIHVFLAGVAAARLFIIIAVRDAQTGGPVSDQTQRVALASGADAEAEGPAQSLAMRAVTVLCRYGCCLGYSLYLALLLAFALLTCPGCALEQLSFGNSMQSFWSMHNGGVLPVFVLILLGASYGTDPLARRVFTSKLAVALSRTSYTQYLIQYNVFWACQQQFGWYALVALPVVLPLTAFLIERCYGRIVVEWMRSA